MKKPKPVNTAIDAKRLRTWNSDFASYRHSINPGLISDWLDQFDNADKDIAARILDAVDFYGNDRIAAAFRNALGALPGWHVEPTRRTGRWFFVSYSSSAGESGDTMLHQFRLANRLDSKKFKDLFIYQSELVSQKLTADDTVVLIDDITATGQQVCDVWKEHFAELVAGSGNVFLIVVIAGTNAGTKIQDETELSLVPAHRLSSRDEFFSENCGHFSAEDKAKIKRYSKRASSGRPAGFGNCGYLVVFQHRCPNNSLPILHCTTEHWTGLFPRHD